MYLSVLPACLCTTVCTWYGKRLKVGVRYHPRQESRMRHWELNLDPLKEQLMFLVCVYGLVWFGLVC